METHVGVVTAAIVYFLLLLLMLPGLGTSSQTLLSTCVSLAMGQ